MSYTFTEHTTDGRTVTYNFRFAGKDKGYLRASDVVVEMKVNGVWSAVSGWTLSGTNQITFTTAPAASDSINLRIRRVVPKVDPYAEFARGVTLDMRAMNYAFIQNLQAVQELMDGFVSEEFYYKGDINYGGNKITGVGNGTNPSDAVNFGQLSSVDDKHTKWNEAQDIEIAGIKAGMTSGTAHTTIPWVATATAGQTQFRPPYTFVDALVFLNGVLQYELYGSVHIANNVITFAEPLRDGDSILVLVGSRIAAPADGVVEYNATVNQGDREVTVNANFTLITVFLDGVRQPASEYSIVGNVIRFKEDLPACKFSAMLVLAK